MSLANLIMLVSSVNADPTTTPDHNVAPATTETVVGRNLPSKKQAKHTGERAAPIHNPNAGKSMTPGITMPERNTLDAKGFLDAMRIAGRRPNDKGIMVMQANEVRNDQIKAIHAFVGYDNRRDFGSQDLEARAKAMRDLRGAPKVTEEVKAPSRSVAGFVAGMPKPHHRILLNLQARERAAAEAMIDATTDEERKTHASELKLVREAIEQLGF